MDSNHQTSDSKSDICTLQTARQKYLKNFLHTDTERIALPTLRLTVARSPTELRVQK